MRISVIIPSRLQMNPVGPQRALFLERAVDSVRRQTVRPKVELEIVVGLDPGVRPPEAFAGVSWVNAAAPSQAEAVNAAVAASSGEMLAFLEDDDYWMPRRLEYGLICLNRCDLATSNQQEVTPEGEGVGVFDFATPSGWLLRRAIWDRLGPFDTAIRFHVDNEFLGRVNRAGLDRIHLVEAAAPDRPGLKIIGQFSRLAKTLEPTPLVVRTVNPEGGMSQIERQAQARKQSQAEHRIFWRRFGNIPW